MNHSQYNLITTFNIVTQTRKFLCLTRILRFKAKVIQKKFSEIFYSQPSCFSECNTLSFFHFSEKPLKNILCFTKQIDNTKTRDRYLRGVLVSVITVSIIIQLRSSLIKRHNIFIDFHESFRFYQKKFLNARGFLCALILSFYDCYNFIEDNETLNALADQYLEYKLKPIRFRGFCSRDNFMNYSSWSVLRYMLSLESFSITSPSFFNLRLPNLVTLGYQDLINFLGIEEDCVYLGIWYDMKVLFQRNINGISGSYRNFSPTSFTYSKIELELFGDSIYYYDFKSSSLNEFSLYNLRNNLNVFDRVHFCRSVEIKEFSNITEFTLTVRRKMNLIDPLV